MHGAGISVSGPLSGCHKHHPVHETGKELYANLRHASDPTRVLVHPLEDYFPVLDENILANTISYIN